MKTVFSFCLALIAWCFAPVLQAQKATPNIVLIFADDLGFKDVGFNGADYYETPNIDQLAREGMRFNYAYAAGANCAPSRACMLSGLYTPRHEVYAVGNSMKGPLEKMRLAPVPTRTELASSFVTMAEALKAAGYKTGCFGKWHLGGAQGETSPAGQGFDAVTGPTPESKSRQLKIADDPKGINAQTDAAIAFITANKHNPFFVYLPHNAVHVPHQATAASFEKFRKKAPGQYQKDPLYAASIYDMDASIGRLMAHLKRLGLEENTLVIFTSDNGGTNITPQEPLRGNKGAFYEGGIREPFVARWTGKIRPGSVNNTPIINLDFYPTFIALAKGKLLENVTLDGENILPLFDGKSTTRRDKIFWHFPGYLHNPVIRGRDKEFRTRPVTTMRKGDYKILLYHEKWLLDGGWEARATSDAVEIYNLKEDEGERTNLASSSPQKRDELLTDLLAWMKATGAKMARVKTPLELQKMKRSEGRIGARAADEDDE